MNTMDKDGFPEDKLSFRTRGMKSPKGLRHVYLASLPEDTPALLDQVYQMLDKHMDIALFYENSPLTEEERKEALLQMQMIVLPVTKNLLEGENPVVDLVIRFSEEQHLPVLPLMFEKNMLGRFEEVFHSVQYLDPFQDDPTAIPFDDKLGRYLDDMLAGDRLIDRVRAAFRSHIFLSYRKKDRIHALKLMNLIHEQEDWQDVAIWYDEFLIPSEDYHEMTMKALKESDLFVLLVTPNLTERPQGKPNYVMEKEYPAACRWHKPILPVELAETDRLELEREYPDLPPCIRKTEEDQDEVSFLELENRLKSYRALLPPRADTPEHFFLIGIGYLEGIEVEKDNQRALKLIRRAAEVGYIEAIGELIFLYEKGKGVACDPLEGIRWRQRLIQIIRSDKAYSRIRVADEVMHLGQAYENVKDYEHAADMSRLAVTILQEEASEEDEVLRFLALGYGLLGDMEVFLKNIKGARNDYYESFQILKKRIDKKPDKKKLLDMVILLVKVGDLELQEGNPGPARERYQDALNVAQRLAEDWPDYENRREYLILLSRFGRLENTLGNPKTATLWYQKATKLNETLAEETQLPLYLEDLVVNYCDLGKNLEQLEKAQEALASYERALEICLGLEKKSQTAHTLGFLEGVYYRLYKVAASLKDYKKATAYAKAQVNVLLRQMEQRGAGDNRWKIADTYGNIGEIESLQGHLPEAHIWYEKAVQTAKAILDAAPSLQILRFLANYDRLLGANALKQKNLPQGKYWYTEEMKVRKRLAEESPAPETRGNLETCYVGLGDLAKTMGDLEGARVRYLQGLVISRDRSEEEGSPITFWHMIEIMERLGDVASEQKDLAKAKEWFLRALEICNALAVQKQSAVYLNRGFILMTKCGYIEQGNGNLSEAKWWHHRSLNMRRSVADTEKSMESFQNLAIGYYNMGLLGERQYMQEAYNLWEGLAKRFPEDSRFPQFRDMAAKKLRDGNR